MLLIITLAAALALMSLGGGFYEILVVDPFWPRRPDLIQPAHGGISRRRFWIAAHVAFELLLIAALVWSWSQPMIRNGLLVALASHAIMRIWSGFEGLDGAQPPAPAARLRDLRRHAVGAGGSGAVAG